MNLAKYCIEDRKKLEQYKSNKSAVDVVAGLQQVAGDIRIESIVEDLDAFCEVLPDRKVDDWKPQVQILRDRAGALTKKLDADFTRQYVLELDEWGRFCSALSDVATMVTQIVGGSWRDLKARVGQLPPPEKLAAMPGAAALAKTPDYARLHKKLRTAMSPESIENLRALRELLPVAERMASEIQGSAPADVVAFLRRTEDPAGADFALLTPEIFQWLRDNQAISRLRVKAVTKR